MAYQNIKRKSCKNMPDVSSCWSIVSLAWEHLKNANNEQHLRTLNFSILYKIVSFNVWARYFVWNFKGTLWNSTQSILPIHWKMCNLGRSEDLRAPRFTSSYVFLKCPPRYRTIKQTTTVTKIGQNSGLKLTKDTPYLTLTWAMGCLLLVFTIKPLV